MSPVAIPHQYCITYVVLPQEAGRGKKQKASAVSLETALAELVGLTAARKMI